MTSQHPRTSDHQSGASQTEEAVVPPISAAGQGGELAALIEKLRKLSPSLDMLACEDVLQAADSLDSLLRRVEQAERGWRCFWCNAVFTDYGAAEHHFGAPHGGRKYPQCEKERRSQLSTADKGWQPIETAPKDGPDEDGQNKSVILGWWSTDRRWQWVLADWTGDEWEAVGNYCEFSHCTPTHWMRPTPPSSKTATTTDITQRDDTTGVRSTEQGERMRLHGPFEIEVKVHITDGESEGVATYSLPHGVYPTPASVKKAVEQSEAGVRKQMGDTFRLMNKREFFNILTQELTGSLEQFALPGGDEWDADESPDLLAALKRAQSLLLMDTDPPAVASVLGVEHEEVIDVYKQISAAISNPRGLTDDR